MYNPYRTCPYNMNQNMNIMPMNYSNYDYGCPYFNSIPMMNTLKGMDIDLQDYGPYPFVIDIDDAAIQNENFRTALWTGEHLQLTLMSIPVGGEIGLEMHPDTDQFLRIVEGEGVVYMGESRDNLDYQEEVYDDFVIIVPAGTWHNLINTGNETLQLYSIYAPPKHPHGTVHVTKEESDEAARREH